MSKLAIDATNLVGNMLNAFPGLHPKSDDDVNGADLVDWLAAELHDLHERHKKELKKLIKDLKEDA